MEPLIFRPTVTISASPDYASGDAVNTGAIALRPFSRGAELNAITIRDAANQGPALLLLFFRDNPSASTITDNAAFVLHADDLSKYCGTFKVLAADYETIDSKKLVKYADISMGLSAALAETTTLYMVIVANGAYNAAATTDLSIELQFVRAQL